MYATGDAVNGVSSAVSEGLWGDVHGLGRHHRTRSAKSDEEAFDFVEDVAASADAWLPGLRFLAPNGLLDVPVDPGQGKVTALRLELPPGEPFRLQSIGLVAEGVSDLARKTTMTASSWHPDLEQHVDVARLLDVDAPTGVLVQTAANGEAAWVELHFDRPVRLTRITLRNVDSTEACRSYGLRITAFGRFRKQHTVYDGTEELRDLDTILSLPRAVAFTNPLLAALLPPLELTLRGHYPAALAAFAGLRLEEEAWMLFRAILNTQVLASRGDSWAIDELKSVAAIVPAA